MSENRRLVLFGASGGTGLHLMPLLLDRGFRVRAVARNPTSIALRHERLEVFEGDVHDAASVARAVAGADAVITTAGPRKMGPTTLYSVGGANIVAAMRAANVRRGVFVTALGTSKDFVLPPVLGFFAKHVVGWFLRHNWNDGALFEAELAKCELDWTVIRPPALNHKPAKGRYRRAIGSHLRNPFRLSRAELAQAVVDQLDDRATFRNWLEVSW